MKNAFFVLALLFGFLAACEKEKPMEVPEVDTDTLYQQNHRSWFNLKGQVKKLSIEAYKAENRFGEVKKMGRDNVEAINLFPGSKYNYLNEKIINLFGFEPVKEIIYFHEDGMIDKVEQFNLEGQKELIKYFKYDEKKRLTDIDYKELDSSKNELDHIVLHPSEVGTILELQQESGDGTLVKLVEKGENLVEVIYADQFGEAYDRFELIHSDSTAIMELVAFDELNDREGTLVSEFDAKGNLATSAMTASEPGLDLHIECTYQAWDEQDNWLTVLITESGIERQIIDRVIEYY